jgi:hypothetical protein
MERRSFLQRLTAGFLAAAAVGTPALRKAEELSLEEVEAAIGEVGNDGAEGPAGEPGVENYTQIFKTPIETWDPVDPDQMHRAIWRQKMLEFKEDMERQMLFGDLAPRETPFNAMLRKGGLIQYDPSLGQPMYFRNRAGLKLVVPETHAIIQGVTT